MDKLPEKTHESAPESTLEFAARRTVIKGLVATVPVVLTLGGGEALANASNFQCITATDTTGAVECITGDDEWVRETRSVEEPPGSGMYEDQECLVYVDADGNPNPFVNRMPLTHSCHNSFL